MPDFSIGVDLGGTNLRIAAVTTDGQLLEKVTLGTKLSPGPDHVITEMCDAILRLTSQYRSGGAFLGAGIGIPGIIDLETGMVRKSANLPGWADYPVRHEIERRLGARILLENDANVHALGEKWLGAARGVDDMAMITLGTGIGGVHRPQRKNIPRHEWHGRRVWARHHRARRCSLAAAAITAAPSDTPPPPQWCAWLARPSLPARRPELAKAANSDPEFSAKSIYNLAIQGDEDCPAHLPPFWSVPLGFLLAGIINMLNLDMYVIGGGVASAWDAFAPTCLPSCGRSLVYAATAPEDPLGRGEAASAQSARLSARKNDHHPRSAGQRRGPLRRRQDSRVLAASIRESSILKVRAFLSDEQTRVLTA